MLTNNKIQDNINTIPKREGIKKPISVKNPILTTVDDLERDSKVH